MMVGVEVLCVLRPILSYRVFYMFRVLCEGALYKCLKVFWEPLLSYYHSFKYRLIPIYVNPIRSDNIGADITNMGNI